MAKCDDFNFVNDHALEAVSGGQSLYREADPFVRWFGSTYESNVDGFYSSSGVQPVVEDPQPVLPEASGTQFLYESYEWNPPAARPQWKDEGYYSPGGRF